MPSLVFGPGRPYANLRRLSADLFGTSTARNKGTCTNRRGPMERDAGQRSKRLSANSHSMKPRFIRRLVEGSRLQSGLLSCNAAEAFARDLFQAGWIEHGDVAMAITDQTHLLQPARRRRYPGPPHRQHHREKFLCERQLVRPDPVTRQQQPTGKALLKAVSAVAGGGLRDLLVEAVRVAGKTLAQHLVCIERLPERFRRHAKSRAFELNHCLTG